MKALTKERIQKEIKLLEKMKPNIRRTSMFGDDHHKSIDAQIKVLKEDLDEEDIGELWNPDEQFNTYDNAIEAWQWMHGESEYKTLTENWKSLLIKK